MFDAICPLCIECHCLSLYRMLGGTKRPLQMIPSVIFILVIAAVLYAGRTQNEPITATASAIVEIWSGNCRQACRQSVNAMHHDDQVLNNRGAGPSSGCVCGACPCVLIDNMLTTVSPAMMCYCQFIAYLSEFIFAFARVGIDEENLSDTVSFAEERRTMKKESPRGYEAFKDTIRKKLSSNSINNNKLFDEGTGMRGDRELRGTQSAAPGSSIARAAPPPPEQDTTKSSRPSPKPEPAYGVSTPSVEPILIEAPRTAAKPEPKTASKPEIKTELKKETKTERKSEHRTAPKPESKTTLEPESKLTLKPESKLTIKPESRSTLQPESKISMKPEPIPVKPKLSAAGTSNVPTRQDELGTTMSRIQEVDSATTQTQGVCRKCVERGKTCVGGCPRAQLTDRSDKSIN